jgi:hypothetical protein
MLTEVYDAFRDAGVSDDKARSAATALSSTEPRFDVLDRKIDRLEAKIDLRFAETDRKIDRLEAKMETRFAKADGETVLHRWIFGTNTAILLTLLYKALTH